LPKLAKHNMLSMNHMIRLTRNLMVFFSFMIIALSLNAYFDLIPMSNMPLGVVIIITACLFGLVAVLERLWHSKNKHTQ